MYYNKSVSKQSKFYSLLWATLKIKEAVTSHPGRKSVFKDYYKQKKTLRKRAGLFFILHCDANLRSSDMNGLPEYRRSPQITADDHRISLRWRRHLVNAYEVRQAWCLLQVKLCDPYLSALKWSVYHARRYTSARLLLGFYLYM